MAAHDVTIKIPAAAVQNTDVEFVVYADGSKLGELHVSQGGVEWRRPHQRKPYRNISWETFKAWAEGTTT